jgi:hypothetical protein
MEFQKADADRARPVLDEPASAHYLNRVIPAACLGAQQAANGRTPNCWPNARRRVPEGTVAHEKENAMIALFQLEASQSGIRIDVSADLRGLRAPTGFDCRADITAVLRQRAGEIRLLQGALDPYIRRLRHRDEDTLRCRVCSAPLITLGRSRRI